MKKTLSKIISTVLMLSMLTLAIGCTNVSTNTDKDSNNSLAQVTSSIANPDVNTPDNGNQSVTNPDVITSASDDTLTSAKLIVTTSYNLLSH